MYSIRRFKGFHIDYHKRLRTYQEIWVSMDASFDEEGLITVLADDNKTIAYFKMDTMSKPDKLKYLTKLN